MALPLFNTDEVVTILKSKKLGVEVFSEFPQDREQTRHGIYVSDVSVTSRTPYQLGVQTGAHIYTSTDTMDIILVTFQGDKNKDKATLAIQELVENNELMDGYHQRDFTVEEQWLNRAEYKTFTFNLNRIEFQ